MSRTRCSVLHDAPQSRDPRQCGVHNGPGSAAHHAARHSASKTRVNALMALALRSIRGTHSSSLLQLQTQPRNLAARCARAVHLSRAQKDRALLPPSSADMFCLSPVGPTQLRELDASVGASGPHDFAVRCNISRPRAGDRSQVFRPALQSHRAQDAAASTASLPAFVTMANAPLVGWDGANL